MMTSTSTSTSTSPRSGGGHHHGGGGLLSYLNNNKKGESYKAKYYRFGFIIALITISILCITITFHNNNNNGGDSSYDNYTNNFLAVLESSSSSSSSSSASNYNIPQNQRSIESIIEEKEKDFKLIATATGTDKVAGYTVLPVCIKDSTKCTRPNCDRAECRPWGHFYDTIYNKYLGKYTLSTSAPIQFLEIGYFQGKGFEAYTKFLDSNSKHELHSMEISCIEHGPRNEGKWPWGNFAKEHSWYTNLLKNQRLHCGDASQYKFLKSIWDSKMKRKSSSSSGTTTTTTTGVEGEGSENKDNKNKSSKSPSSTSNQPPPPLMVVVDDGSHITEQMATSLFFWLPRLHPGGILIIEDIQPIVEANKFRTHILPQLMKDLHWCGDTKQSSGTPEKDLACFPQIQSFIHSIHCEMHICVFTRNNKPSEEPNEIDSIMPVGADSDDTVKKCLFGSSA
jgi:hypothetical protein